MRPELRSAAADGDADGDADGEADGDADGTVTLADADGSTAFFGSEAISRGCAAAATGTRAASATIWEAVNSPDVTAPVTHLPRRCAYESTQCDPRVRTCE